MAGKRKGKGKQKWKGGGGGHLSRAERLAALFAGYDTDREDNTMYDWDDGDEWRAAMMSGWGGRYSHSGDTRRTGFQGGGTKADDKTPPPPPDPALVRAVTDYRVFEGPDSLQGLVKPLTWFMAGNGLVPVRVSPMGTFIGKAAGPAMVGLPELKSGVALNCPKLTWMDLCEVIAFFRDIHKDIKAEAMVQYFWDPTGNGGTGEMLSYVPPQLVSAGGVHHTGDFDAEGKCWHVLDIHSHHTMSPFWSGTDDADEARFEGRLYGVVGHIDRSIPEIKWRTRVGGAFVDLTLEDVIDVSMVPPVEVNLSKSFHVPDLVRAASGDKVPLQNTSFLIQVDPFKDATYPKEWRAQVVDRCALVRQGLDEEKKGRHKPTPTYPPVIRFKQGGPDAAEKAKLTAMGYVEKSPNEWVRPLTSTQGRAIYFFSRKDRQLYVFAESTGCYHKSVRDIEEVLAEKICMVEFVDDLPADKIKEDLVTAHSHLH